LQAESSELPVERNSRLSSRLPRRPNHQLSVAELVKRYQEYLPSQGIEDLAKTALPPQPPSNLAESDQESSNSRPPPSSRNRLRHSTIRKVSTSDVEQSYAASIAPRYLTRSRRKDTQSSRIPGPVVTSAESQEPSRQPSPEKRGSGDSIQPPFRVSRGPPPNLRIPPSKTNRGPVKDKGVPRPLSSAGLKTTLRRPSGTAGSKVSNIAKHFERISKDSERANRRYAVIRGRRARPVASARAKVEVFDSVKDAIKDEESENSDSSSEADDEGGDEDDNRKTTPDKASPEASTVLPQLAVQPPSQTPSANVSPATLPQELRSVSVFPEPVSIPEAVPEDAVLSIPLDANSPSQSPNIFPVAKETLLQDIDLGLPMDQRSSIMKALSGFWPREQVPFRTRSELENEDPMVDPEHIFRDSSMVVRTDEPTSIIALALK
jgi:1-phosphatidylinositol-3-phosphate 5-kinase